MIGHGVSSRSSHSCAAGRTTSSAKPWTQSRMSFWSWVSSSEKTGSACSGGVVSSAMADIVGTLAVQKRAVRRQPLPGPKRRLVTSGSPDDPNASGRATRPRAVRRRPARPPASVLGRLGVDRRRLRLAGCGWRTRTSPTSAMTRAERSRSRRRRGRRAGSRRRARSRRSRRRRRRRSCAGWRWWPGSASPSEPPIWREVLTRPEASPASERATPVDGGDRDRHEGEPDARSR